MCVYVCMYICMWGPEASKFWHTVAGSGKPKCHAGPIPGGKPGLDFRRVVASKSHAMLGFRGLGV